ncbi:MAG: hypothetical protein U0414_20920 [Polyangiaceae bacterium]
MSTDPAAASPSASGAPSPQEIVELADACVRFVERVTNVRLDFAPETLPVLDHYLRDAARASTDREEARDVVVLAAGAYFGELVRRRYPCWWRLDQGVGAARIEFATMFLAFSPMDMVRETLRAAAKTSSEEEIARDGFGFELDEEDQALVEARLAELPAATTEEFHAPSTRLEVLDITVDAIRSKRLAEQDPELALEPADYDD